MAGQIDYGGMMHRAMQRLISDVLTQVADRGLPGEHHFYITFDTCHPQVEMSAWLGERYPEEMTIVIQHWYEGLDVREDGFGITLNFGNSPERLEVPFDALRTFVDPSVEFGLRFESQSGEDTEPPANPAQDTCQADSGDSHPRILDDDDAGTAQHDNGSDVAGAEVVRLDKWRK